MIVTDFSNGWPTCVLIPFLLPLALLFLRQSPLKSKNAIFAKIQNGGWWPNSSSGKKSYKTKNLCLNVFVEEYLNIRGPRTILGSIKLKNWFSGFSSFEFLKNYGELWTKAAPLHDIFFQIFLHQPTYHTHRSRYSMLPSPHFSFCLQRAFLK